VFIGFSERHNPEHNLNLGIHTLDDKGVKHEYNLEYELVIGHGYILEFLI